MELQQQQVDNEQRQNRILSAVAFSSSVLLKSANWKDALIPALEQLGRAVDANRAYYFENSVGDAGDVRTSQVAEWAAAGIEAQIDNPDLQDVPYVQSGMGRWLELLSQRKPVHGLISTFPDSERAILEPQGIQSLVAMPVFSQDRLNGFLGFDDCESLRRWSSAEFDALFAAASALGAAIDRHHLENQLRFAQKMEAVGSLASGVAHDFNNMLQAITGFVTIAKSKLDDASAVQNDLDDVLEASHRAHGLTQQLLSFASKKEISPEVVDLQTVCNSVIRMLRPKLISSIQLETEIVEPAPFVVADPGQVGQVLLNLCLNACDSMPNGGRLGVLVDVVDDLTPPDSDATPGPYVRISVTDTGCGMTPGVRERIFEPFFTTKNPGDGTGLGLSVAYGSVRQCGGWIDVETACNIGSQFDVYLPLALLPGQDKSDDGADPESEAASATVLLVDDEPLVLQPTKTLLELAGYAVLTADSGSAGLKLFREQAEKIDIVVSDCVMPEMSGVDMLNAILNIAPETKAILVTGNPESTVGVDKRVVLLNKPFSNQALQSEMQQLLGRVAES